MEEKFKPAFYNPNSFSMQGDDGIGLTKREYMATQILAGFSANRWSMELGNYTFEMLAEMAVKQTDVLLEELSKPKN